MAASLNTPSLFIIAVDLSRMQIKTNVDESDIGQVQEKVPVRFTVQTYHGKTFLGEVTQIRLQPKTISNVVNYIVVVDAENDDGLLLPGMTATADLIVGRAENVLLVPNSALRFTPDHGDDNDHLAPGHRTLTSPSPQNPSTSSSVYILKGNGRPGRVAVETGLNNDLYTEVKDNLLVRDGMMIISGEKKGQEQKKSLVSLFPPPPGN